MELSVCFIVKNEEEVIERILKIVKDFADEIIVVDTGSKDKTKQLAQKYTDKIFDYEWEDDFSKARNFSFSKATKEYIMWLDADDYITKENVEKIKKLKLISVDSNIFMFKYAISFDKNNNPTFSYYRERIVKNSTNNLWKGFLHEAITLNGKVSYEDIVIEHRKIKNGDSKRNLKIYNKKLKKGIVLNTREQYYYSKELFYNGYYKKCIKELKKYLKMENKFLPNVLDTYLTIGFCYEVLNQKEKALKILLESLIDIKPSSELLCEIAKLFLYFNNVDNAIFFYESALNIEINLQSGNFVRNEYYHYIPLMELTRLYFKIDYNKSKKYHLILKEKYPFDERVLYNDQFF